MRKVAAGMLAGLMMMTFVGAPPAKAAGSSNGAWGWQLDEWWTQLGYTGMVWFWKGTVRVDGGKKKKATDAWLRFYAGSPGNRDTGKIHAVKQLHYPNFYKV